LPVFSKAHEGCANFILLGRLLSHV
jgi:hypothetical protein